MANSKFPHNRVVIVRNPNSTRSKAVMKQTIQLHNLGIELRYLHTDPDPVVTERRFLRVVSPNDTVVVGAGDGTANTIANILLREKDRNREFKENRLVVYRGGNANDSANMQNGKDSLVDILLHGSSHDFRPLRTEVQRDKRANPEILHALAYFGIGADATASLEIEKTKASSTWLKRVSGFQLVHEAITSWGSMGDGSTFYVKRANTVPDEVSDVLFLRGDRIAKLGRPHGDLGLPLFERVESGPQNMTGALIDMPKMQRGAIVGDLFKDDETDEFTVLSQDGACIKKQHDGEVSDLESGDHVTVRLAEEALNLWTTKL